PLFDGIAHEQQPIHEEQVELARLWIPHAELLIDDAVASNETQLKANELLALPTQHHLFPVAEAIDNAGEVVRMELVEVNIVNSALAQSVVEHRNDWLF